MSELKENFAEGLRRGGSACMTYVWAIWTMFKEEESDQDDHDEEDGKWDVKTHVELR